MIRPTLSTIAERCGVAQSTVSRALNRPDLVRPALREQVLREAANLGYRPNRVARALATGKSGRIGLLVPDVSNPFFSELLRVIHGVALNTAGSSLLIVNTDEKLNDEAGLLAGLAAEVDGLILASPRSDPSALRAALQYTPTVFINRPVHDYDKVLIDYRDALEEAGEHLRLLGHRRIAIVRGPAASWAADQRANAVIRWASHHDLELIELHGEAPTYEAGVASVGGIVESRATAVVAYDDMVASGVIAGLLEAGLHVPDDVAVIGCDDTLLARLMTPSMTTVRPPYSQVAVAAVDLLNDRIKTPDRPVREVRVECTLAIRGSSQPR